MEHLVADMRGVVLEIYVKAGDPVKKGDEVLAIEAMKMEVPILSPVAGVVDRINVARGDAIEANAVLADIRT